MFVQNDRAGNIALVVLNGDEFERLFKSAYDQMEIVETMLRDNNFLSYPDKNMKEKQLPDAWHSNCLYLANMIKEARQKIWESINTLPAIEYRQTWNGLTGKHGDFVSTDDTKK